MSIKCFYHRADLDGQCSGAIVKHTFKDAILYPIDYGIPLDKSIINKEDLIIIVDFSFDVNTMDWINQNSEQLIWIDHHKTAIEKCSHLTIFGIRDDKFAACELTWKYFHHGLKIPKCVYLLGRYDVWDHTDPDVLPFQYGMKLKGWEPEDKNWNKLLFSDHSIEYTNHIRNAGEVIYEYETIMNEKICKQLSFNITFEGLRFLTINRYPVNLKFFEKIFDPNIHDACMAFCKTSEGFWRISMYTPKDIDLSVIAKQYGGGGHKQACGFEISDPQLFIQIIS